MKSYYIISLLVVLAFSASCGDPVTESLSEEKYYADGVKLITPSITDPRDDRSMGEGFYNISSTSRLLIRLENISSRSRDSVVDVTNRMYLTLSSDEFIGNKPTYGTAIKVCPITKNWMMLATWKKAHPFPTSSGEWSSKGGDFDLSGCVTYDAAYPSADTDTLYYDISDWYIFYVRSRSKNYGLMIYNQNTTAVEVYGDNNSLKGMRFIWPSS